MDSLFEYSAEILGLTRSIKFALAKFHHFHKWLLRIFQKTEDLINIMLSNMKQLYDIVISFLYR